MREKQRLQALLLIAGLNAEVKKTNKKAVSWSDLPAVLNTEGAAQM